MMVFLAMIEGAIARMKKGQILNAGVLIGAVVLLLAMSSALAETPGELFDSANQLYEKGQYGPAAAAYLKLLERGDRSVAVYFNLGNAYFKSGQIGHAILAYRQAERVSPRDPDVRANLQFARKQTQGPAVPSSRWIRWLAKLTLNEWTLLLALAVWLLLLLLAVRQWKPGWKPALRGSVIVIGVATLVLAACLGTRLYHARTTRTAVVVVKEAQVRQGPFDESNPSFTAHDGAELRVIDAKNDWLQVTAGPRRMGWVRRDVVEIAPPT